MEEGWECVEGCPIRLLDEMSGDLHARGNRTPTKRQQSEGSWAAHGATYGIGPDGPIDSGTKGGASKYFKTFPPETEDNLIEPVQEETSVQILRGDCVEEMRAMPENSVDSVVTDPPYDLTSKHGVRAPQYGSYKNGDWRQNDLEARGGFMGMRWDATGVAFKPETWEAVLRVLKPGGFLLAFGGTRTVHRLACAIEDAGFEIRDTIQWIYGSGFPKSAKVIPNLTPRQKQVRAAHGLIPKAGLETQQRWGQFGSALKPAHEPIVVARKPLSEKSLRAQFFKHFPEEEYGTGMLNIDASRVGMRDGDVVRWNETKSEAGNKAEGWQRPWMSNIGEFNKRNQEAVERANSSGRFPANLLLSHVPGPNGCVRVGSRRVKGQNGGGMNLDGQGGNNVYAKQQGHTKVKTIGYADPDGLEEVPEYICADSCAIRALDEMSGVRDTGGPGRGGVYGDQPGGWPGGQRTVTGYQDKGGASRFFVNFSPDPNPGFFYTSKASKKDRTGNGAVVNDHPTCKPANTLMRYLVKLVTPPGGIVLDPFAGSFSTGVACIKENFNFIGIEQDEHYCDIGRKRINAVLSERAEPKKNEVKTAKEWGLENVHPQDTPLRYNPDECPEEGGAFEPVEEFSGRLPF